MKFPLPALGISCFVFLLGFVFLSDSYALNYDFLNPRESVQSQRERVREYLQYRRNRTKSSQTTPSYTFTQEEETETPVEKKSSSFDAFPSSGHPTSVITISQARRLTPGECPTGWTEADLFTIGESTTRTCYIHKRCTTMNLHALYSSNYPKECPEGWQDMGVASPYVDVRTRTCLICE